MMSLRFFLLFLILSGLLLNCQSSQTEPDFRAIPYDESQRIAEQQEHDNPRMRFSLFQSKVKSKQQLLNQINPLLSGFDAIDYDALSPYIMKQSVNQLQEYVREGKINYTKLSQWYLYRIAMMESDSSQALNAVISIHPKAIELARTCDQADESRKKGVFGIPVMLKDNIGAEGLATTAGAEILKDNYTNDAFLTQQIKSAGGIILAKLNLSEWAYYFCEGCPLGYSAIGGQTLNPHGPGTFETGGSSAGSGVALAANYAPLTIGTETAGSILSPASKNGVVGLKPTIGLLSRSGIVPISKHLDTPGPMSLYVEDAAILLDACIGDDPKDTFVDALQLKNNHAAFEKNLSYQNIRLGVIKAYQEDSLYRQALDRIEGLGAELIEIELGVFDFTGFREFLNYDMKEDLPQYMADYAPKAGFSTVADVIAYNNQDTLLRAPYGQGIFEAIARQEMTSARFDSLKMRFFDQAEAYFENPIKEHDLDAILSINNYNAAEAAMARFPALTMNMGFTAAGEPVGLTFIGRPFTEKQLFSMAYTFEQGAAKL